MMDKPRIGFCLWKDFPHLGGVFFACYLCSFFYLSVNRMGMLNVLGTPAGRGLYFRTRFTACVAALSNDWLPELFPMRTLVILPLLDRLNVTTAVPCFRRRRADLG